MTITNAGTVFSDDSEGLTAMGFVPDLHGLLPSRLLAAYVKVYAVPFVFGRGGLRP